MRFTVPRKYLPITILLSCFLQSSSMLRATAQRPVEALPVRHLTFSPDGGLLAACYGEVKQKGKLRLWDIESGACTLEHNEDAGVCSASFSPDGRFVAVGSFTPVGKIIEVATGEVTAKLQGHDSHVRSVCFVSDRVVATASYDKSVRLWDATSGEELGVLGEHADECRQLDASPDGRFLISGSTSPDCRLWDLKSGKQVELFEPSELICPNVCFSADGKYFVTGRWDGRVRIRDTEQRRVRISVQLRATRGVAFSPDNNLLLACDDRATVGAVDVRLGGRTAEERERILELAKLWRSDDYEVREQASRDIVALGLVAVPLLDKMVRLNTAEIRIRAREARSAIVSSAEREIDIGHNAGVGVVAFSDEGGHAGSGDAHGEIRVWRYQDQSVTNVFSLAAKPEEPQRPSRP